MPSTFSICTFAHSGCQSPGQPTSLLKLPGTLTNSYSVGLLRLGLDRRLRLLGLVGNGA